MSEDGQWPFHPDIMIKDHKIIIEVDGKKNHSSKKNKAKDRWKDSEYLKLGYQCLRITVDEALGAPEQMLHKVDLITGRNKKNRLS